MSDKSTLGDCCQKHNALTAPVVYPRKVVRVDDDNLRAEYRCACGNDWSCWWSSLYAGWTDEDIERLNQATAREDTGPTEGEWFHRGPCHKCAACGGNGCHVWNDNVNPEIHICENGCDGLPGIGERGMMLYEVYAGVKCPVCGNADGNHDCGPYEVAFPAATADHGCPQVHYITCGRCGKGFDAGPRRAASRWQAMFDGYPA